MKIARFANTGLFLIEAEGKTYGLNVETESAGTVNPPIGTKEDRILFDDTPTPEPEHPTLEHREGEYLHWTILSDFYAEFTDGAWHVRLADSDYWEHAKTPEEFEQLSIVTERIISHGFLAPGKIKPAELPRPEIGEHIWLQRARADGPVYAREFYTGVVMKWVDDVMKWGDDPVGQYLTTDDPEDGGTWWPSEKLPSGHVRVVAWGLVEPDWKVGDVVPAGTSLDRMWLGRRRKGEYPMVWGEGERTGYDREILWIEED